MSSGRAGRRSGSNTLPSSKAIDGTRNTAPKAGKGGAWTSSAAVEAGCAHARPARAQPPMATGTLAAVTRKRRRDLPTLAHSTLDVEMRLLIMA
jgi:hypothetical protein